MKKTKRRRKLKKSISAGVTVFCLCLAGVLALLLTPTFNVKYVMVRGNTVVSDEAIINAANIPMGENVFGVSMRRVRDNVQTIGSIKTAKAKRALPSGIIITVEESAPIVYIYDHGDCVGITAEGKVTDVKRISSEMESLAEEKASTEEKEEEEENSEENDSQKASSAKEDEQASKEVAAENEAEEKNSGSASTGLERAVVTGMGKISYKVGGKIKFSDKAKADNLYKLLDEFFGDEACTDVSRIDMEQYERISFTMKSGLKVYLGEVSELGYKLKCFKAIISEQLDENPKGTLDLERLTYSPKNK